MRRCFALLLIATTLAGGPAWATIYKWVDGNGVVHYSDTPAANAKPADLPSLQRTSPPPASSSEAGGSGTDGTAAAGVSVSLQQPEEGATFRDGRGLVPVQAVVTPKLGPGQQLRYYLDGKPQGQPGRDISRQLQGVPRGTHTVSVAVVAGGSEITRSPQVTIYMKPPSSIGPIKQQSASDSQDQPAGATTAPPTTTTKGAPAAPQFNTGSAPAGAPRP